MNEQAGRAYYLSRRSEILAQFDSHARAWWRFLVESYGAEFAEEVVKDARARYQALIPDIPYIGGDENPLTRHLVRATTSLILYLAMKARGRLPEETGRIVYDALSDVISQLPPRQGEDLTPAEVAEDRRRSRISHERLYPGDWVWDYVDGNGIEFDYGYDFLECGAQKLYHAYGADEFLPFYCYLDFVTNRSRGWGFTRTMTLAEGHDKCDFRWKRGGHTRRGWPPPFLKKRV